jgi:hypothetical protein
MALLAKVFAKNLRRLFLGKGKPTGAHNEAANSEPNERRNSHSAI